MNKPEMKRKVGISLVDPDYRKIKFSSSLPGIAQAAKEFGILYMDAPETYELIVDPRFDYQEVLEYIRNFDVNPEGAA